MRSELSPWLRNLGVTPPPDLGAAVFRHTKEEWDHEPHDTRYVEDGVAYIGVDPGLSGALALVVDKLVLAEDMPTRPHGDKREIDHWTLAILLRRWLDSYPVGCATVERVHAMPKQGVTSSFNFGAAFGAVVQALASENVPVTFVHPATWKAIYGLRGGRENKAASRVKAQELFPAASALFARAKDDGRAEAALLAHYGRNLP